MIAFENATNDLSVYYNVPVSRIRFALTNDDDKNAREREFDRALDPFLKRLGELAKDETTYGTITASQIVEFVRSGDPTLIGN